MIRPATTRDYQVLCTSWLAKNWNGCPRSIGGVLDYNQVLSGQYPGYNGNYEWITPFKLALIGWGARSIWGADLESGSLNIVIRTRNPETGERPTVLTIPAVLSSADGSLIPNGTADGVQIRSGTIDPASCVLNAGTILCPAMQGNNAIINGVYDGTTGELLYGATGKDFSFDLYWRIEL